MFRPVSGLNYIGIFASGTFAEPKLSSCTWHMCPLKCRYNCLYLTPFPQSQDLFYTPSQFVNIMVFQKIFNSNFTLLYDSGWIFAMLVLLATLIDPWVDNLDAAESDRLRFDSFFASKFFLFSSEFDFCFCELSLHSSLTWSLLSFSRESNFGSKSSIKVRDRRFWLSSRISWLGTTWPPSGGVDATVRGRGFGYSRFSRGIIFVYLKLKFWIEFGSKKPVNIWTDGWILPSSSAWHKRTWVRSKLIHYMYIFITVTKWIQDKNSGTMAIM